MIAILIAALTGFVNLPQLVAAHPLAPVLAQYDRELAALRSTERVTGLTAIARGVSDDARTIRAQTENAGAQARRLAAASPQYEQREAAILQRLATDETAGARAYGRSAQEAATASLADYRTAMAQRTARALSARRQQLNEAESTLAFDLAKRNAGRRLTLELKLRDLHLLPAQREQLRSQLGALDAREAAAVDTLRHKDNGILSAYAATLRAQEAGDDARMTGEIAHATAANVAARRKMSAAAPDSQALRGYRFSADAADIDSGFTNAGSDLTQRFAALESADRSSHAATEARIAQIAANRSALYDAIVAQITSDAHAAARDHHLRNLLLGAMPPRNAVDLTAAVRSKLRP
ncbi:MAG: hypothetical protein JO104_10005 [Candidatus Eremiobacteraeota bacterium]|nr:hypothetical protein [Candidatus Eremiobacteraeota bacterium]